MAQHYRCATCLGEFTNKDVQVDHTIPIGTGLTWDEFINGLFCEEDNLQVLCVDCHKTKTKNEKVKK